ncbi:MAG: transposase [Hyphomonadaceae bacterium]|nr:transposase [Hyphomonadaceae bacterium]
MTISSAAGVDVGRDWLDVAIARSSEAGVAGRHFRLPNTPAAIAGIPNRLRRAGVTRVVIEATGAPAARLVRTLAEAAMPLGVVDPRRIKALRLAEGRKAKTDKLDAGLIARFALLMTDAVRPAPSPAALELRALSTRRRQLVEMIAAEKTRLKQAFEPVLMASFRLTISLLSEERARIEAMIEARTSATPEDRRKGELLRSIPGIGPTISATLMADLPELGALDNKAIASLAGVAPHIQQSGAQAGRAHIQGGRPCVRAALYMAALSAVRHDAGFKADYKAMRAAGKPAKVALIAIARKLIVAANAILKHDEPWKPAQRS